MPRKPSLKSQKRKTPINLSTTSVKEGRSILKKRQRKPLQEVVDLHLTADTNIPRSTSRRVSFAVSEVKEFRQPANEGTLWGSSYFVDIQKSSSESENTGSSTSGFQMSSGSCSSELFYSQQVIVQETSSISYSEINSHTINNSEFDESEEFREDLLPDLQSNHVCELIDAANQTEESVFQDLNNSKHPVQNNDVYEVATTKLLSANSGKKIFDPSVMLGEFLQSKPKPNPCETFERPTTTDLSYSSASTEIDLIEKDDSLPINTRNKHQNSSAPCKISLKHGLSLCDDTFETAKKQKIGTEFNDVKLLDWLKDQVAPVREHQSSTLINNQLDFPSKRGIPHDSHCYVEDNMQNYSQVSKLSLLGDQQFAKAPHIRSNQHKFPETLGISIANTFIKSNRNGMEVNEISNNTSDDMSMSFTSPIAPLLNISSTSKDGSNHNSEHSKTTSGIDPSEKLNLDQTSLLSGYNHEPIDARLLVLQDISDAHLIEKNVASISDHYYHFTKVHKSVSSPMPAGRIADKIHVTNENSDLGNISRCVSPTMSLGRIISQGQSSPLYNCKDISGVSVSPTLSAGRILGNLHTTNTNSDFANVSNVSPTMPLGRIISQGQSSPLSSYKDICRVSVSPTTPVGRTVGNLHTTNTNSDFTNDSSVSPTMPLGRILDQHHSTNENLDDVSSVSPTIPMGRIISRGQSSPLSSYKDICRISVSPTTPVGKFHTTNTNSDFANDSGSVSPTMPLGRIISQDQSSALSNGKDISGVSVSPTLPGGRILDQHHSTNENLDSVSPTMPMGRIISQGQSSPLSSYKDISRVSVSPTTCAGRTVGKLHTTNTNSDFANDSSLSPTMPLGRIISQDQSSALSNGKDISGVSVSPTLPGGRILDQHHSTNENLDNASSVSPTMPMGRIISQGQSSPLSSYKDISTVSVSPTTPAGRTVGKLHTTNTNSEFFNVSRSVSPTMPLGRIISEDQSSALSRCKDISGVNVSPSLCAGRILDQHHSTNENLDNVSSVSPTMPIGRIISQGQSSTFSSYKDISTVSDSTALPGGRILDPLHTTSANSDFAIARRSVSPTIPLGRKNEREMKNEISEKHSSKNEGYEDSCGSSVSPTMPMDKVLNHNQVQNDNVELASIVMRGNNDEEVSANCASLKLATVRDMKSTSPFLECNPDSFSNSSNINVSPKSSMENTANCEINVLTETLDKMCVAQTLALKGCKEKERGFPHFSTRKQVEKICNNAPGTSAVGDSNVLCKREIQIGRTNNALVATCGNVLRETQDLSDCKNVQKGFYNSETGMVESNIVNSSIYVKDKKDTVDKIEGTSSHVNEEEIVLPLIKINNNSVDFSENTESINNPVICERNVDEAVDLNIEKDPVEQKGETSLPSNKDYNNCSNIKVKEDLNIAGNEENDQCGKAMTDMNDKSEINLNKSFVSSHTACNTKSSEKENYVPYADSFSSSEPGCDGNSDVRFCGTKYLGDMKNNGNQRNNVNTNEIFTDNNCGNKLLFYNGGDSDTELDFVSSPTKFHVCNDNYFSSEVIGKDSTLMKNGEMVTKLKNDKGLVVSATKSTNEKIIFCDENTNIHVNREESKDKINKKSVITKTVSDSNRPSICISGIDYIDWKSSLDVSNALVSNNKSRTGTIFPEAQQNIQDTSISCNYSSETEGSDISKSSLISLSNIQNDEFEGANDILIKSFRSQGRNDLLKERSISSFLFHNEMSMTTVKTPCKIGNEASCVKLSPQYVPSVTKLMNVDTKSDLDISPLEDDKGVNSSTNHLQSIPSNNSQPQDCLKSISSSNSAGTCAKTELINETSKTIRNERSFELPSDTSEEDKIEMYKINSHTYSESTDQILCSDARNDNTENENKTMKGDVEENIELPADVQVNETETLDIISHTPSKSTAGINFTNAESDSEINESKTVRGGVEENRELSPDIKMNETEMSDINSGSPLKCTNAESDFVINESKTMRGYVEENFELPTDIQMSETEMLDINSHTPSKSITQINFIDAKSDLIINEHKIIEGNVKWDIELSPNIQTSTKETEIHSGTPSKSTTEINCLDKRDSPCPKKARLSPQVSPSQLKSLSNYKSFCRKENEFLNSSSLKRYCSEISFNFERWIQEQQESEKCPWKVELVSSSKINFYFLEKNVKVYVEIDPSNLNLIKIDIKSYLKGSNIKNFLNNLVLRRLKIDTLQDRFPTKNDIPALINFISSEEDFILDFAKDWEEMEVRYAIVMKENFWAEFEVTSLPLSWLCDIKIDLSSWNGERLHSRYVQVCPVIGEINGADIIRLMRAIPGGPHLLKDYISHFHNYIHTKEKFEGNKKYFSK